MAVPPRRAPPSPPHTHVHTQVHTCSRYSFVSSPLTRCPMVFPVPIKLEVRVCKLGGGGHGGGRKEGGW